VWCHARGKGLAKLAYAKGRVESPHVEGQT